MIPGETALPDSLLGVPAAVVSWALLARLPALLRAAAEPSAWRELLRQAHEELKARFLAEEPVEDLVHARAALIDIVIDGLDRP